jgi:drug/metabolite transporter (DMT)-like permease
MTRSRSRWGNNPPPLLIDFALLFVALMWASTFTLFKIAWEDIDPLAFTGVRFVAIFVFSIVILGLARSKVRPQRADVPTLIASGLTGYFLYQMGFVLASIERRRWRARSSSRRIPSSR